MTNHIYTKADFERMGAEVFPMLLNCDPETGKLSWKFREFEAVKKYGRMTERYCAHWNARYAGKEALTSVTKNGYFHGYVCQHKFLAHRVAWCIYWGEPPAGQIDHINGDKLDNSIQNLRSVTHAVNSRNKRKPKNNTSGYTGVVRHQNKWRAQISNAGKHVCLGSFDDIKDAAEARRAALAKYGYHENHGTDALQAKAGG